MKINHLKIYPNSRGEGLTPFSAELAHKFRDIKGRTTVISSNFLDPGWISIRPSFKMTKIAIKKKKEKAFKSSHNLIFEQCAFEYDPSFFRFRIGTCEGLWTCQDKAYVIVAVTNLQPGNGDFEYVLEIFENSCRRDGYSLRMAEFFNDRLKKHMIEKRGFKPYGRNDVEKTFSD